MANKKDPNNKDKKKENKFWAIFVPVLIIVIIVCFVLYSHFETQEEDNLSYDALITSLNNNEVEKLEMQK